jgi:chemotaxis protein methyltransferase CheR
MIAELDITSVERFRSAIARCLGLQFDDTKSGYLADVLRRRLEATRQSRGHYLARMETDRPGEEIRALAQELTVAETYFFRHLDQFHAFSDVALPGRVHAQTARRRLAILSAGCASGEEAYSLAILVFDAAARRSCDVSIVGVDVNPAMLEKARRARFSTWALRDTPADVQRRWFHPAGRDFVLDDVIRGLVTFEEVNLIDEDQEFWQPDTFDIVFCRNVLMYFGHEDAQRVVARIARAIQPGGYLFLGHAETLRGMSNDFHLCHTHSTFYYQRKEHAERPPPRPTPKAGLSRAKSTPLAAVVEGTDSWIEAIHRASERIEALTSTPDRPRASGTAASPASTRPTWDLGAALEFFRRERFTEALEMVQALPSESQRDPDVLLLQAVLLTHCEQPDRAEEACRRLLAVDEMNAGAHYLLALCREGVGDREGALNHDQTAVYLDPGFAMPRLHLGLLARRTGDRAAAQRELGQALVLLQREDSSRLLLFGGGFGREALIALARAELIICGGQA